MGRLVCSICGEEAVARIEYAGLSLCRRHYIEFILRKARRANERYRLLGRGDRVLVAVSGGKDSATALDIASAIASEAGAEVHAIHIDLGIPGYSSTCRAKAIGAAEKTGVGITVIDVGGILGDGVPGIARKAGRPVCSVCGCIKRFIINAAAVESGATVVVTGHNLDDIAAYAVKEFLSQNLEAIGKLIPRTKTIEGLVVGRARILYDVYEWESLLYAKLRGLPFAETKCPYYNPDTLENMIKRMLREIESRHPSTVIGFARRLHRRSSVYTAGREEGYGRCPVCGLVSGGGVCSFCRLTRRVFGRPLGGVVRERIRGIIRGAYRG